MVRDHVLNRMAVMNRVVVVGSSGSGKTTVAGRLARALDVPFLEMDSVFHRYGWADDDPDAFLPTLDDFTRADRWVVDGNYTSHGVRDVVWPRADTFVWLDPPRRIAMSRVVGRTLRRVFTREELWGGVREPFTNLYSLDPLENIMVWTWTRHAQTREKFETALVDGSWHHATVHRLRTSHDVERFLHSQDTRA
jgi:adenylate kinase family enzyme